MKGKVDILVASQYYNGSFVQIYRSLYYEYTIGDVSTNISKIYLEIKENVKKINIIENNVEEILSNLREIYTRLPHFDIVQKRMPRFLIKFYEKVQTFRKNADLLFDYAHEIKIRDDLESIKQVFNNVEKEIMTFWKNDPLTFFRMPLRIIKDELAVELFKTERFLPYILGTSPLPLWTDPIAVSMINETRKIIQIKEQTKIQKDDYFVLIRLLSRKYNFDWAIKLIIEYLPITFSFDLMISETPWEFSLKKHKGEITVRVT